VGKRVGILTQGEIDVRTGRRTQEKESKRPKERGKERGGEVYDLIRAGRGEGSGV